MCHTESCVTVDGDHFKHLVYEEIYFNLLNTQLTKHFYMFCIFSQSDGADFAMTHLCNKEVSGKIAKDFTDFQSN
jgi:hypothetical protein